LFKKILAFLHWTHNFANLASCVCYSAIIGAIISFKHLSIFFFSTKISLKTGKPRT